MIRSIPDSALSIDMLPSVEEKQAVFTFAMTFDGYDHFGSLDAAVKHARTRSRACLVDLRNELFLAARASRHSDNDRYLDTYAELLPHFKKLLEDQNL